MDLGLDTKDLGLDTKDPGQVVGDLGMIIGIPGLALMDHYSSIGDPRGTSMDPSLGQSHGVLRLAFVGLGPCVRDLGVGIEALDAAFVDQGRVPGSCAWALGLVLKLGSPAPGLGVNQGWTWNFSVHALLAGYPCSSR